MRESMIEREREEKMRGCLKEEKGVRTRSARKRARSSLLAQHKQGRGGVGWTILDPLCSARWMLTVDHVKNPHGSRDLDRTIGRWRSIGECSRGRRDAWDVLLDNIFKMICVPRQRRCIKAKAISMSQYSAKLWFYVLQFENLFKMAWERAKEKEELGGQWDRSRSVDRCWSRRFQGIIEDHRKSKDNREGWRSRRRRKWGT